MFAANHDRDVMRCRQSPSLGAQSATSALGVSLG
jgi:hypothetical protein